MNKPHLSQLLAASQLAEMAHQADPSDYKRQAMEQAQTEYNQALLDAEPDPAATATNQPKKTDVEILQAIVDELDQAYQIKVSDVDKLATRCARLEDEKKALADECKQLYADKMALVTENSLLKNQQIEKGQKIDELEKSPLSAKPASVETATVETTSGAPEAAPALTPYQKGLLTRQQNLAKAAAEAQAAATEEPKKNS